MQWFISKRNTPLESWAKDTLLGQVPAPLLETVRSGAYSASTLEGIWRGLADGSIKWHQRALPTPSEPKIATGFDEKRAAVDSDYAALREQYVRESQEQREVDAVEAQSRKNPQHVCDHCLASYPRGENATSCMGTCNAPQWRGKPCRWSSLSASQCTQFKRKATVRVAY